MNVTSSDLQRAAEILAHAPDDSPEKALFTIAQMLRNLTHDRLLDSVRIDWIAINGYAVRDRAVGTQNVIQWSDQVPAEGTRADNLRLAIDDAMRGLTIDEPRSAYASGAARCDRYRVRCPKCLGLGWIEGPDSRIND